MTTKPATAQQTAPRPLGCLPKSVDVPQVKAAIRLLTHDGQPLAALDRSGVCVSGGAYLDPRQDTGEVVLAYLTEDAKRSDAHERREWELTVQEYADLFAVAGWSVKKCRENDREGVERLARLILTPPPSTARERMTTALAEYGITAHLDKDAGNSWLVIPLTGDDFPGVGTPQLVAFIYEAHEDWVFVDAPMEHWAGTWEIRFNNGAAEAVIHRCDPNADPASATAAAAKFVADIRAAWNG